MPEVKYTVVVVTVHGTEIPYTWATGVRVDRKANLRIMDGWRQRAYHPADEWARYTVDMGILPPERRTEASAS